MSQQIQVDNMSAGWSTLGLCEQIQLTLRAQMLMSPRKHQRKVFNTEPKSLRYLLNGLVFLCGMKKTACTKASEMFALSMSGQATVDQKQIATMLCRPEGVCTAGPGALMASSVQASVTMSLFVANSHWRLI